MSSKAATKDNHTAKRMILVRQHLKMSTTEMAIACKVSQPTISRIENGERDIPTEVFRSLYINHNISPIYILAGESPMVYDKTASPGTVIQEIPKMRADIEVLKGQVKMLVNFINKKAEK